MDLLNNHFRIPSNIILFFFAFCFNSAESAWLPMPKYPYLNDLFTSLAPAPAQPPVSHSKPTPPSPIPTPYSTPRSRLEIFPSSFLKHVASPRPQISAPTTNSPSPSSWPLFFSQRFPGSPKTKPHRSRFMQSIQLNEASSSSPDAVDQVIQQLCNETDHSDLCISSVGPFLAVRGKAAIDAITMLKMVIKACSIHTEKALIVASKLPKEQKYCHRTAMAIMDCKEMYTDALDGLQTALDAIQSKDIGTINSMLSGVITDAMTCEDGFERNESPLRDFDDRLHKMGSNCLAIANLIQW